MSIIHYLGANSVPNRRSIIRDLIAVSHFHQIQPKTNSKFISHFTETYENRTETIVDSTPNEADLKWIEDYHNSLIETLSFENFHDGQGEYKLKY